MKTWIGALLFLLAAVAHAQAPPGTALEREFADGDDVEGRVVGVATVD